MRILAIDFGKKRIGLAISDEHGIIAQALKTIAPENLEKELSEIIQHYQIAEIVIGLPRQLNGSAKAPAQKVTEFAHQLAANFKLPVKTLDERFTTKIAEHTLITADVSRKKRKIAIDKIAATLILQCYLDQKRR